MMTMKDGELKLFLEQIVDFGKVDDFIIVWCQHFIIQGRKNYQNIYKCFDTIQRVTDTLM